MPIFVNCTCGKRLQGREEDAGKQTRCPFCGAVITLPASSTPEPERPSWSPPPSPEPAAPEPTRSARTFRCTECDGRFEASEVYSEAGSYICKRCFNKRDDDPDPPPRRDRFGEPRPSTPRSRRRYDDDDDDYTRPPRRHVPTYLTESILVTLFCCPVFGIVSIIYASQVENQLRIGDYGAAVIASNNAKTWCGLSLGLGLLSWFLSFIMLVGAGGRL